MFSGLVEAEGIRRGAGHVRQLTILGDGAAWIWNIATAKFPEATQIVDLFHAREHLHDLARLLEFMLGDHQQDWLAARLEDLDYGDIDGICDAARVYPLTGVKKGELDTALGYFENNAPRMRYQWFRSRGLFIGSGAVESGCKAVIGQRLKQSGMHWTVAGASAIATLRCQQASRPEDQIWTAQPDVSRLTSPTRQTNLFLQIDAHPQLACPATVTILNDRRGPGPADRYGPRRPPASHRSTPMLTGLFPPGYGASRLRGARHGWTPARLGVSATWP